MKDTRSGSMLLVLVVACLAFSPKVKAQVLQPGTRVAQHFVARLLLGPTPTSPGISIGYLTYANGISGSLFSGTPGVSTAYFTFRTVPASFIQISNGNVQVALSSGVTLDVYLNQYPNGDWNNPDTFSSGQLIATFKFRSTQLVNQGPVGVATWSGEWTYTPDFSFDGKTYNFGSSYPNGLTGVSYVNSTALNTIDPNYPLALTSAGSLYAIGPKN